MHLYVCVCVTTSTLLYPLALLPCYPLTLLPSCPLSDSVTLLPSYPLTLSGETAGLRRSTRGLPTTTALVQVASPVIKSKTAVPDPRAPLHPSNPIITRATDRLVLRKDGGIEISSSNCPSVPGEGNPMMLFEGDLPLGAPANAMVPWKDHAEGNVWSLACRACKEPEDDGDEDTDAPWLHCYYCDAAQHRGCTSVLCPGIHPEVPDAWVCPACWADYMALVDTAKLIDRIVDGPCSGMYKVSWVGSADHEFTWEPPTNLPPDLLSKYLEPGKKKQTRKNGTDRNQKRTRSGLTRK